MRMQRLNGALRQHMQQSHLHTLCTPRSRDRFLHFGFGYVLLAIATFTTLVIVAANAAPAEVWFEPFSASSPFRQPIASDAPIDPHSSAIVANISRDGSVYANLVEFGIPIYFTGPRTPRQAVSCTFKSWGPCALENRWVPIPDGARPSAGTDGAMVVVDQSSELVFEFWQAKRTGETWTASFGAVNRLDGSGWGDSQSGFATASGASRLAGVVRLAEIEHGTIAHALAVQSRYVCSSVFRAPARKTDGRYAGADCLPEGARIRLDPAVDLDELDLPPAVRVVATAMQVYGAFAVDYGGAPMSVAFERDGMATDEFIGSPYEQAGLKWDYDGLGGVPWDRLEVMA